MTEMLRTRMAMILLAAIATTGTGWIMIAEVTGTPPVNRFLYTGFALSLGVTAADTWLHWMGRTRALYRLLARGTTALLLTGFIACLLLPMFWIEELDGRVKLAALALLSLLCGANAIRGFRQFRAAWAARGAVALAEHYQQAAGTIDWDWIMESLRIEPVMYLPLMNRFTIPLAFVAGLGGFMFGPSLVYSWPAVGALGWTFAIACMLSFFVQLLGSAAAQTLVLVRLEQAAGRPLAPRFADESLRPLRRKRRRSRR